MRLAPEQVNALKALPGWDEFMKQASDPATNPNNTTAGDCDIISPDMPLAELANQLSIALEESKAANNALEEAQRSLAPLEAAAENANNRLSDLMTKYQAAMGEAPARKRTSRVTKRPRTAEENVRIQESKARTVAEKQGLSKKDIEKAVKAAGEKAAQKAGIPYQPEAAKAAAR